jgi:Outer membrane cobalamin receptor protein
VTQLDPIIIREDSVLNRFSDPTGFERRRRNSVGGHFMTADQISRTPLWQASQLLRRFPGIAVSPRGQISVDRGATTLLGSSCNGVMILIDGIVAPDFDVDMIPVSAIRGIEVYSGPATTPMELTSGRTPCGTVAIWTR